MLKQNIVILILIGMVSWCYAQEIPLEVMEIMNNYTKDSTADVGFLTAKRWLKNSESINASDIEVGKPIQEYRIKYDILDTCSDSIPFHLLIEPKDCWIFPIKSKSRYLYNIIVTKFEGVWHISGRDELPLYNMWDQLRNVYPESTGINPVLVVDGLSQYFYFKQKGPRKIYYIRPGYKNDSLEMITPGSLRNLDDSKKLIKHWKKQGKGSNNSLDNLLKRNLEKNNGGGK